MPRPRPDHIIFCDIDGVLVIPRCYPPSGDRANAWPACVEALNQITDATGAGIVVTSTRRRDPSVHVRSLFREWGATGTVVGVTPVIGENDRRREILEWLDDYPVDVRSFVILDDDGDMGSLLPQLVRTNSSDGLTLEHAARAISILGQ